MRGMEKVGENTPASISLWVWAIYQMAQHRGWSVAEVARAGGLSDGRAFYHVAAGKRRGESAEETLFHMEDGIDRLTAARGYACTCTPLQRQHVAQEIEEKRYLP